MIYVQQYLITGDGIEPFTTEWFDPLNHFDAEINMKVYNLHNDKYTTDGSFWFNFQRDHL